MEKRTVTPSGKKIVRLRQKKGWSQEVLAAKVGCAKKTVERVEHGKPALPRTVAEIAAALGVVTEEILVGIASDHLIGNSPRVTTDTLEITHGATHEQPIPGHPKVFISHTTQAIRDHNLARKLAEGLRAHSVEAWIAPEDIPPGGSDWEQEIICSIMRKCTHFLVILSSASVASKWVQKEIALARQRYEQDTSFAIRPLVVGTIDEFPGADFINRFHRVAYQDKMSAQLDAVLASLDVRAPVEVELSVELAHPKEATRNIGIRPQRNIYAIGDEIRILVRVSSRCHLLLVNIGPTGTATILFPSEHQRNSLLRGGEWHSFPPRDSRYELPVLGPAGVEKVIAIASDKTLLVKSADFEPSDGAGHDLSESELLSQLPHFIRNEVLGIGLIAFDAINGAGDNG